MFPVPPMTVLYVCKIDTSLCRLYLQIAIIVVACILMRHIHNQEIINYDWVDSDDDFEIHASKEPSAPTTELFD